MALLLAASGLLTCIQLTSAVGEGYIGHVRGHPGFSSSDVEVKCLEKSMEVYIPKNKIPQVKSANQLQLVDAACTALDNGTHYIGNPWLKDCGTVKSYQYDGIVYSNTMTTKYPKPGKVNSNCPIVKIKFACFYPFLFAAAVRNVKVEDVTVQCEHIVSIGPALKGGIIALSRARARLRMRQRTVQCPMIIGVGPDKGFGILQRTKMAGFTARRKTILCKELESAGNYRLQMAVFSDDKFSKPITGQHIAEKEFVDVYYEVRLLFGDNDVEIMPSTCYATPTKNPESKIKYYFLKDGCILDDTVQFYATGPVKSRFSIQSFKFAGQEETSFYIHCEVKVCELNDVESVCRQGCQSDNNFRAKRNSEGWGIRAERKIIRAPELSKVCLNGKMEVVMSKDLYPGISHKAFHLNDKDCKATDNGTHFVFKGPVGHCGAMRSDRKSRIYFRNMVYLEGDNPFTNFFPMEVSCSFSKAQSESARAKFILEAPRRFFQIKNEHPYRLQFKVLVAYDIPKKFTRSPVRIISRTKAGNLDIVNDVMAEGITLRTKHCTMKNSLFSPKKIQLIHKGCPANKRVLFYENSGSSEILRILLDPNSIRPGKTAHLTCTVIVCRVGDHECSRPCGAGVPMIGKGVLSRRRRSTEPSDVGISCGQTSMTVVVRKSTLPPVDAVNLRLRDSTCRAFENRTHFIFTTPLGSCGTAIVQDSGGLAYTNQITQDISRLVIVRQRLVNIPFRCLYRSKASASSGEFRLRSPQVLLAGSSKGVHEVKVKMFTDATFTKERDGVLSLVDPEEDMYFEVGMAVPQPKLAIVLDQCYGKPTGSLNEREKYVFIREGCGIDDTVKRYESPSYDKARFSVKPFQFSNKPINSVYVTCKVSACNPNDPEARCFRECSK